MKGKSYNTDKVASQFMVEKETSYQTALQNFSISEDEINKSLEGANDQIKDSVQRFITGLPPEIQDQLPHSLLLREEVPDKNLNWHKIILFFPKEGEFVKLALQHAREEESVDGSIVRFIPLSSPQTLWRMRIQDSLVWVHEGQNVMACLKRTLATLKEGGNVLSAEEKLTQNL